MRVAKKYQTVMQRALEADRLEKAWEQVRKELGMRYPRLAERMDSIMKGTAEEVTVVKKEVET